MMGNALISGALGIVVLAVSARADSVTFDFNSLGRFDRDRQISDYMTAVYGSGVTTNGARATDETSIPGGTTNMFIATSLQLLNRGDFEVLFESMPIISARFEGHVLDPTLGEDFNFWAYSGNTEVLHFTRDTGEESFDSGLLNFSQPVDRLVISDNGRKDVGIDDLTVVAVPDPASGLLLLAGVGAFAAHRRK
jgi:hypothetical protein